MSSEGISVGRLGMGFYPVVGGEVGGDAGGEER